MKKKGKEKQQTTSSPPPQKKTRISDVEETSSKIETKLKMPF